MQYYEGQEGIYFAIPKSKPHDARKKNYDQTFPFGTVSDDKVGYVSVVVLDFVFRFAIV